MLFRAEEKKKEKNDVLHYRLYDRPIIIFNLFSPKTALLLKFSM
jgi:hypothetical protein